GIKRFLLILLKMEADIETKTYKEPDPKDLLAEDYQLQMEYAASTKAASNGKGNASLMVLSLFSGCGGMDLGFEGGFSVHQNSVNKAQSPDFIKKKMENGLVMLKKTRFSTVFANDILPEARNAWVHYFSKKNN